MAFTSGRSKERRHEFFGSECLLESSSSAEDLDARIARALRYMATKAASNVRQIDEAVEEDSARELSRDFAAGVLDYLQTEGVEIRSGRMMDLGAGLGMLSEEAAARGANPLAVEPGSGFREIALARIRRSGSGAVIAARAEELPFRDGSFDLIISLETLEHVQDPAAMLREVERVLRPGGWFYVTCPNYLGFREPHYSVAWLPLFPKPLALLYLKLRGRPTEFLKTSITYTTLPWVRRELKRLGLQSVRDREISAMCHAPASIRRPWKRAVVVAARRVLPVDAVAKVIDWCDQTAHLCTTSISELVQKPYNSG